MGSKHFLRSAWFNILAWALFFGGFCFAVDVCIKMFVDHRSLDSKALIGIAGEKLAAGLGFGLGMWLIYRGKRGDVHRGVEDGND